MSGTYRGLPLAPEDQYDLTPDPEMASTPAPGAQAPEPDAIDQELSKAQTRLQGRTQALDGAATQSPASYVQQLREAWKAQADAKAARFDPTNYSLPADAPSYGVPEPAPKTSALGDFARQAWIATTQMGQAAVGAASFTARQLGADPEMVGYLEEQKAKVADYATAQANKLSPEARDAMHASLFGGKDDQGNDLPSPSDVGWGHYVGASVASMVPQIALAVLPGGLVGRAATKIAGEAAGFAASVGTTGAAFGTQSAGEAYNAFTSEIDKASESELMRSPVYKELRDQGVDDIEARRQLVRSIAPGFVAAHFGVGAVAGVGVSGILGSGAAGAAGRSVFARAGIGAAEGAATMGGQAGAEDALSQKAEQQAGVRTEFDPSQTAKAFASGALGGAALGAGGGMLHGGATTDDAATAQATAAPTPRPSQTPSVTPDMSAALNTVMQGVPKVPDAPPPVEPTPTPTPTPAPAAARPETATPVVDPARAAQPAQPAQPAEPARPMQPEVRPEVTPAAEVGPEGMPAPEVAQIEAERAATPVADTMAAAPVETPVAEAPPVENTTAVGSAPEVKAEAPTEAQPVAQAAPTKPKTKRQLEKERLAQSQGRMKGTVATVEADVPPDRLAPEKPLEQSQAEVKDALDKALNKVTVKPIQKGMIGPALTKARREIDAIIRSASNENELHEAVAKWGTDNTEPLPMSTTLRRPIADHMLQLLTGQGYKSEIARGVMASDRARSGSAPRERVGDADTLSEATPEATTVAAPAASEGVTNYDAKEKERTSTADKSRVAQDLLDKVLDGSMTVHEAHAAMGEKAAGSVGRSRKYADFGEFLDAKIKHAEDPAVERQLLEELARTQNDKGMAKQQRAANTARLQTLLEETGEERAGQLRELRAQLDDPVGHAVTQEAEKQTPSRDELRARIKAATEQRRAMNARQIVRTGGISPEASRYVRMAHDPRVNREVRNALVQAEMSGRELRSHDLLRTIANSSMVKAELRPLRELASRLLTRAPDVPVTTMEEGVRRGLDAQAARASYGIFGSDAETGRPLLIAMDPAGDVPHVTTFLHEVLHSVTSAHLEQSIRAGGQDAKIMQRIHREMMEQGAREGSLPSGLSADAVRYAMMGSEGAPDGAALHELHTMLMSDPSLQAWAARMPVSDSFRADMTALGYPTPKSRSVWQVFTDWVRRTLGMGPASASEHTLLDHIMRPLQDIVDRGAEFNQRAFDKAVPDPVVRAYARPFLRATGGKLTATASDALRRVDPMGLGDKARRGLLMGATTDAIHDWNRALFEPSDRLAIGPNPLTRFRDAQEAIGHTTKQTYDRIADRARAIVDKLGDPALGPLMNDATIAGVRLGTKDGKPADNAHLTEPEQQASLRELQARFDRLSPESKQAYEQARDLYAEMHSAERRARLEAMVRLAMPDVTDAQVGEVAKALRSKRATEEFLNKGDSDALAAAFGQEWHDNRELVRGVAKVHTLGFVPGDYFPLRRFGDYVIRYGEGDNLGVEMFERRGEAEARRSELLRQDVDNLSQVLSKRESKLQGEVLAKNSLVDTVADRARAKPDLRPHAEALRDLLTQTMLEYASRSEAARTQLRRKGVKGASTDAARVMAQEFVGHGARMGHLAHDAERNQALRHMRLVADDLGRKGAPGEQIRAQAVIHELEQRLTTGDDAQGMVSGIARRASTLGFVQSLMSPSHMLTSAIEAHMNSSSLLGARHGAGKAGLALTKALLDVSPKLLKQGAANTLKAVGKQGLKAGDWNLAHVARDRLIKAGADSAAMHALFDRLDQANLIDHTMQREMQRIANPGGLTTTGVGKAWQRFLDLNAAGAHAVDVANKAAIAKAAFDLELRKSGSRERAIDYAVETVRKVMPNYNLSNKARISTSAGPLGGFAAPITQFKQYGIHMYSVMANLTRAAMHGASKEERREARKAMAGILVTHALMAGGLTLIADPLRYVGGAWDFITGASQPHDYQNDVRAWLSDTFGPEIGELVARGLPHAAGIDIHRRVGLANLLEIPELNTFDKEGVLKMFATAMTGAAGDDAAAMVDGMGKLAHGDLLAGVQGIVPRVLRDAMKAQRLADAGVQDSRGKTILPAEKLSPFDVAAQAVGFQPAAVSEFREGRQAVREAMQETQDERNQLTHAWLGADPNDRSAVMSRIREFNMAHPQEAITMAQLIRGLQQRHQDTQQSGQFGLRVPRKGGAEFMQAGRFANVR